MASFLQMQQFVSKRLLDKNNTAVPLEAVQEAINAALDDWKVRRFWFNQKEATVTMTTGNNVIPLPADFLIDIPKDAFVLLWSTLYYPLAKVSPLLIDSWFATNNYAMPSGFSYKAGNYLTDCLPDQDYPIIVYYLRDYDPFVNDNDTNDFSEYAAMLLQYDALSRLHGEYRQDEKMEAYYSARTQNEYQNLLTRTNKLNSSGRLSVDTILGDNNG